MLCVCIIAGGNAKLVKQTMIEIAPPIIVFPLFLHSASLLYEYY